MTTDAQGNDKARSTGVDAVATINGSVTVGDGLDLKVNTSSLDLDLTLNYNFGAGETSFAITGGGAQIPAWPAGQLQSAGQHRHPIRRGR